MRDNEFSSNSELELSLQSGLFRQVTSIVENPVFTTITYNCGHKLVLTPSDFPNVLDSLWNSGRAKVWEVSQNQGFGRSFSKQKSPKCGTAAPKWAPWNSGSRGMHGIRDRILIRKWRVQLPLRTPLPHEPGAKITAVATESIIRKSD